MISNLNLPVVKEFSQHRMTSKLECRETSATHPILEQVMNREIICKTEKYIMPFVTLISYKNRN